MENLLQDIRYGIRMLRTKPGFTLLAALALGLGIGANTCVFSVLNGVLLKPLPYKNADRLMMMWNRSPGLDIAEDWLSPAEYFDIKNGSGSFEQVAAALVNSANLTSGERAERVNSAQVSASLFEVFSTSAAKGRLFLPDEDEPGKPRTVVITDGLWRRTFGADPDLIGKSLILDAEQYTVVGILPREFVLNGESLPAVSRVSGIEVFTPLPFPATAAGNRDNEDYNVIGRLKPTVTAVQAQAEVDTIVSRLRQDFPKSYPPNSGFTISVVPLQEHAVQGIRQILFMLMGAVAFVLLIACANVASLLLSRGAMRHHEIAIRTAVGASRWRLVRQFLTESVLLGVLGGGLGLLATLWGVSWLRSLGVDVVPRASEIAIDGRVLIFTLLISLITGVVFGLVPAIRASQIDVNRALKESGRQAGGEAGTRSGRGWLTAAEIALSLVLLAGAGLLIRSFSRLQAVDPGFSPRNVLSLRLSLPRAKYPDVAARGPFYKVLQDKIRELPGVESVGMVSELPLSGNAAWTGIWADGYVPSPGETLIQSDLRVANVGYFDAMKIPLISGRYFDDHDTREGARVAIVDERFANRFYPGQEAIGKRVKLGSQTSKAPWMTIVGVARDVRQYDLDANPRTVVYVAYAQYPVANMYLVARGSGTAGLGEAVTSEILRLDPELPPFDVSWMEQRVTDSLARRRFSMLMLTALAVLATVLVAVGIYGVISHSVSRRTHEIGIRMALGASSPAVLRLILSQVLRITSVGIGVGVIASLLLTRLMTSMLYSVRPTDPLTFFGVSLLLGLIALAAGVIPARRATSVDPVLALRDN